jgi:hypothetical protein
MFLFVVFLLFHVVRLNLCIISFFPSHDETLSMSNFDPCISTYIKYRLEQVTEKKIWYRGLISQHEKVKKTTNIKYLVLPSLLFCFSFCRFNRPYNVSTLLDLDGYRTILNIIYINVCPFTLTVLNLDFQLTIFLFFPQQDFNTHKIYIV